MVVVVLELGRHSFPLLYCGVGAVGSVPLLVE